MQSEVETSDAGAQTNAAQFMIVSGVGMNSHI